MTSPADDLTPSSTHSERLAWTFPGHRWTPIETPRLMGILNVTPDSFSDGGQWIAVESAVEHALKLIEDGAQILDIGGESTRPGSQPVPGDEQVRRVVPVIERLASLTQTPISIDTSNADVARRSLEAGAVVVNDITALTGDAEMPAVCAESRCGIIAMHMQGTPQTMQIDPRYDDVVSEVSHYLAQRIEALETQGITRERIVIDPGIGFGKTAQHNVELLANVQALHQLGRPVLIGHSRKGFLKKVLQRPVEERLAGTIGVAIAVAQLGADLIRVHDVAAVRDAIVAWRTILNWAPTR